MKKKTSEKRTEETKSGFAAQTTSTEKSSNVFQDLKKSGRYSSRTNLLLFCRFLLYIHFSIEITAKATNCCYLLASKCFELQRL